MKKLLTTSLVVAGLCVMTGAAQAAPARGSNCVDVAATATCSKNVVSGVLTVTNCSAVSDTFAINATVTDPYGLVLGSEGISMLLKGGKARTMDLSYPVVNDPIAGTYTVAITAAASKGTGKDATTVYLTLPCP